MRLPRIVLVVWLAWFGGIVLMWSMFRLRVMHPHFLPLTSLVCLQVVGGVTVLIGGVWRVVRGPKRKESVAWMLLGITPLWLWSAHLTYGIWRSQSRYVPMDTPLKLAGAGGAALVDAGARFRYPNRLVGDKAVMIHRDVPLAEKQVAAMDQHVRRLEELLGRRCRAKVHWVRGGLFGFEGRYFQGLALGSHDDAQPDGDDGLNYLDRHEVAHFVLHHHCGPDSEPPSLLVEGWAEAQSGYEFGFLAQRLWEWKQHGPPFTLRELTGDDWYSRMMWPVYVQGGPLVDFMLREYGAEKFFQLYVGCRRKSFSADCERILGVGLDELDRLYWADVEDQIATIEPEEGYLPNVALAEGVDVSAWRRFATSYLATKTDPLASLERIQLDVEIQTELVGEDGKPATKSFRMQVAAKALTIDAYVTIAKEARSL